MYRDSLALRDALHGRRAMLMAALCALALALAIASVAACRPGVPVIDPGEKPPTMDGTISGTVRGPDGTSSIVGRQVEVINVDTGERQVAQTSNTGGFTFKVKPGKYRVEVVTLQGESVIKRPGVMNVNRSDVDAHADFVLGSGKASRRPGPPPPGLFLGQPVA
jgi:Carboxypeptidase regulatory-like domain